MSIGRPSVMKLVVRINADLSDVAPALKPLADHFVGFGDDHERAGEMFGEETFELNHLPRHQQAHYREAVAALVASLA